MSDSVADVPVDDCLAAYRTLEIDARASATAIRQRYRELATRYHPDKWPHASQEQASASARMAEINAAYQLIRDAPLEDCVLPEETIPEPTTEEQRDERIREVHALDLAVERTLRFAAGAGVGLLLGVSLYQRSMMGQMSALVLVPLVFGLLFAVSPVGAWRVHEMVQAVLWWFRIAR